MENGETFISPRLLWGFLSLSRKIYTCLMLKDISVIVLGWGGIDASTEVLKMIIIYESLFLHFDSSFSKLLLMTFLASTWIIVISKSDTAIVVMLEV